MGGGKAKGGAKFSSQDQLKMQQEMINQELRAQAQQKSRAAVEAASKMPAITTGDVRSIMPAVSKGPDVPGVKIPGEAPGTSDIPTLGSIRSTKKAPSIIKATKAPKIKEAPDLPPPSLMPTRDRASFLAAKKVLAKEAASRQGRASTILSRAS